MDKLKTIAEEVGVSPNTVLRVLRGQNKEVWPSAIRRAAEIRELAERLGYLPNGSARAVRRGRFNCVSLVLSSDRGRSHLPDDLFNGIHDALVEQGIRLVVSKLSDERLTSGGGGIPTILRDWSCDGLLINYTDHIPQEMIRLIDQYRIPSIWINSRQAADCVYYDDFGGAMAATQHLLKLGHRRITYLDFSSLESPERIHYSRIDRYEGYAQAMRSAGLPFTPRERYAGVPVNDRLEAVRSILKEPDRPTAIVSYDAGERLLYAAALEGLRVPQDLSLVTFITRPPTSGRPDRGQLFIGQDVTAMRIPAERAAALAVEMLLKKIAERSQKLSPSLVPLEFEVGDTCGPVTTA